MINNSIIRQAAIELHTLDNKNVVKIAGVARRIVNWIKGFGDPEFQKKLQDLQAISPEIKSLVDNLSISITGLNKALSNTDPDAFGRALEDVKPMVSELSIKLQDLDNKTSDVISEAPVDAVVDDNGRMVQIDSLKNLDKGWFKDKELFNTMKGLLPEGLDVPISRYINKPVNSFEWLQKFSPKDIRISENSQEWIIDAISKVIFDDGSIDPQQANNIIKYLKDNKYYILNQLRENILSGILRSYTFPSSGQANKMSMVVDAGTIKIPGLGYDIQFPTVFLYDKSPTIMPVNELEVSSVKNVRALKDFGAPKQELDENLIRAVLDKYNYNIANSAKELGLNERTLRRRMESLNIFKPEVKPEVEQIIPEEIKTENINEDINQEDKFNQFLKDQTEEQTIALRHDELKKMANYARLTETPNIKIQNKAQEILGQIKDEPIGTTYPFSMDGIEYLAKLETHPPSLKNLRSHPGISLFAKQNNNFSQVAAISGLEKKSPEFISELINIGNRLNIDPSYLASVMRSESGFDHTAVNPMGGATGLIQFMPSTSKNLGTSTEELASMTDVQQLAYVEKFFKPWAGKIKTPGDLYMATFLPIFVGKSGDTIIGEKGNNTSISGNLTYNKVWEYNKVFDYDKDGIIRVSDVTGRANKIYQSGIAKGYVSPNTVDNFNKIQPGKSMVTNNITEEQVPMYNGDEANELMNFLYASGPIEKIVKRAIYEKLLPKTRVLITVGSVDEEFYNRVRYAKILSSALRIELDGECSIHNYNNKIEIEVDICGSKSAVTNAVYGVCEGISEAFELSIGKKISSYSVVGGKSAYALIDSDTMELCFRKFAFDMGSK